MPTPFRDKYYLKTVHEEIGLLDRKLAHLLKYETFATDKERDSAASKLSVKRATLMRVAQEMTAAGIEYKPAGAAAPTDTVADVPAAAAPHAEAAKPGTAFSQMVEAAYAGSSLDYRSGIDDYMRSRRKQA